MIPDELRMVKQWSVSFDVDNLKRPRHTKYKKNGALTYDSALSQAGSKLFIGLYVTPGDPYILGDIDHVESPTTPFEELPLALSAFLQSHSTYAESSPSGHGIRFVVKLADSNLKKKLEGKIFYTRESSDKRSAQINTGPPWMTITGHKLPWAEDKVAEVTLEDLDEAFELKWKDKKDADLVKKESEGRSTSALPPLSEIKTHLLALPIDQNPRIRRAFKKTFNADYQHYDYWLKVLMALHDYAEKSDHMVECHELAIQWSRKDEEAFSSEEDVSATWRSFRIGEDRISYKTLFRLSYYSYLVWPKPKKQSKEEKERGMPRLPLTTEYVNFKALLNHFNINLVRDSQDKNLVYITGDEDVLEKYFSLYDVDIHYDLYWGPLNKDTMVPGFHIFCQDFGFLGVSHGVVQQFLKNHLAESKERINLVRVYFDTPFDQLPDSYRENEARYNESDVDYAFSALTIEPMTDNPNREIALYRRYYECWLMGLVRNIYYPYELHQNNCVLLLTGREQIRKTSHFRFLLPSFFRDKISFPSHGFGDEASMRDIAKISSQNLLMVWDELEHVLNAKTESNFKKVLDNIPQTVVDKYEVVPTIFRPVSIYGATSNLREFKLGQEGSRRIFHIPVSWVDTDKLNSICWHGLVRGLKDQIDKAKAKGEIPWLLSEDELSYQLSLHVGIRAKTTLDYILLEAFGFEEEEDPPMAEAVHRGTIPGASAVQKQHWRLQTTKDVFDTLGKLGYHTNQSYAAMEKTLERLCGDYTKTRRKSVHVHTPRCTVYKGRAVQAHYKKWVMPPARDNDLSKRFM